MKQLAQSIWEIVKLTISKAKDDDIVTHGAAIAFYTIFSVAPLLILIVSVSSIFLSEEVIYQQIQEPLDGFLDPVTVQNLSQFLLERTRESTGLFTTVIALGAVIFGATTVITQLKASLNIIWNVTEFKLNSVWNFLLNRALSFGMILLFSLLLLLSLLAEAVFGIINSFFSGLFPAIELGFYSYVTQLITIVFAILFFTLVFKILPDVNARWIDISIGATITTILFLIGKYLIGFYLSTTGIEVTYKAAGSLIVFTIWVYYNIQIVLLGAVFTQVYTEKYGGKISPYRFVGLTLKNK